jgi:predicted amidohydrolase
LTVRVAAVNWKLRSIHSDGAFWNHAYEFIERANDDGAQLVILPELFSLELLYLEPKLRDKDCPKYLVQYWEDTINWLARMSVNSGMAIVGGSHFHRTDEGIKHISPIAYPDGQVFLQEKNKLTVYERSDWEILPGHGVQPLPGRLGVSVCYDCEFPEGPRRLAEDGMLIHAVPAWTETRRGFQRVRWSSLARAIENQVFVIHSSLVGDIGREPIPESYGSSAIIAPSIAPFPMEAILAESKLNEDDMVIAGLDIDALFASRNEGEVTNWHDRDASTWQVLPRPNSLAPWVI